MKSQCGFAIAIAASPIRTVEAEPCQSFFLNVTATPHPRDINPQPESDLLTLDEKPVELLFYARPSKRVGVVMMEADKFQTAIIAELAALRYVLEQVGEIAFLAAAMRPEHAAAMRQTAKERLARDTFPGLEAVWSDHLGAVIVDSASAILTNIETALAESYLRTLPPTSE